MAVPAAAAAVAVARAGVTAYFVATHQPEQLWCTSHHIPLLPQRALAAAPLAARQLGKKQQFPQVAMAGVPAVVEWVDGA